MKHAWLRILTAAIFLLAQLAGASASGPSCSLEQGEGVRCSLPCCSGGICDCGMAPSKQPAKPAPAPQVHALKFMPVFTNNAVPHFCPLIIQKPIQLLAADAFLPHCPPALALHCALLI